MEWLNTEWPIVERTDEAGGVRRDLLRLPVRAQLITGPAGVGKTVLARQVVAPITDRTAVSVIALQELAGVPLGAFTPALADLGIDAQRLDTEPRATMAALLSRLGRAAEDHILVVDDAPRLDDLSASLVYQLIRAFGVPMIATGRIGERLPGPITRLAEEGLIREHRLAGLATDAIDVLLERRFGVRVQHTDVARLTRRTDGNPYYLRTLIEAAERTGSVSRTPRLARIQEGPTPPDLLTSIAAELDRVPATTRRTLHLISLTQPADPQALRFSAEQLRSVRDLVHRGLVTEEVGTGRLRVAHPLVAEVIEDDPAMRPGLVDAARHLRSTGASGDRFTAIRMMWDAGLPIAAEELVWAADRAYAAGDLPMAAAIATAALDRSGHPPVRFRAMIVRASTASMNGDLADADARFLEAVEHARRPEERALLAARLSEHLAFRRLDVPGAVAAIERVQRELPPDVSATLDGDLTVWRALLGEVHDRAADLSSFETHPELAVRAAVAAIMTESMRGRTRSAREAAAILSEVQSRLEVLEPAAATVVGLDVYFDLLSRGDHTQALDLAESRRMTSGDGVGLWTCTVAEHRSYNGHLTAAGRLAAIAVDQCRWRDGNGMLPLALALQADTTAKLGDHRGALRMLSAMEPAQRSEPKAAILVAECEAWLAHAAGDSHRAADILVRASQASAEVGYLLVATLSLGLCIRIGFADRAAALLEDYCSAVPADFVLYTALRDLAVGLRDRRPDVIPDAAAQLSSAGMAPTALDAIALARRLRPDGRTRRRLEVAALSASVGVDAPLLQDRPSVLITARERQVALAAADRERSREIADRLGVSVRTVDNQLQSVYRKLGVRSRDELRAALVELGLLPTRHPSRSEHRTDPSG